MLRGQKNVAPESLCVGGNLCTSASGLDMTTQKHFTKVSKYFRILSATQHSLCSADFVTLQQ